MAVAMIRKIEDLPDMDAADNFCLNGIFQITLGFNNKCLFIADTILMIRSRIVKLA